MLMSTKVNAAVVILKIAWIFWRARDESRMKNECDSKSAKP